MTVASLNGRVRRLEAMTQSAPREHACRTCGLRHVLPLTLALLQGVLRVASGSDMVVWRPQPLCLCEPCCGAEAWLARLSHGLPDEDEGVAR
jgi:hypothetical protein